MTHLTSQEYNEIIGKNIRSIRKLCGVTQVKLAEFLGITYQQVQKYEKGQNGISAAKLWKIAIFLDIEIKYFLEENVTLALVSAGKGSSDLCIEDIWKKTD